MKIFLIKIFIIFFSISLTVSFAQTNQNIQDSVYAKNFLMTNLFSDVNLANLNSVANYNSSFGKFSLSLGNYYMSNVSKLDQNFFRDYNNFRFLINYNVKKNFAAGIGFQNKFLTDDKNIETNRNNSSYYFTNLDLKFNDNVIVNSKLGFKTEDQIGEFNTGFSGLLTGTADNYLYKDYMSSGRLILFYENLNSKKNHNYELNAEIYKRFTKEADNTGKIRYYNQRNDFYFPATASVINQYNVKNNIEKRTEDYFYAGDYLNYSFTENLLFSLEGSYAKREITKEFKYRSSSSNILFENVYDTKILEDNLELSGMFNYNIRKLNSRLRFMYNERSENHSLINISGLSQSQISELEKAEKNKNNNGRRTSITLGLLYLLSNTHSFGFDGSSSMLRYDTDFDLNYDDRDEAENIASVFHKYDNLINFELLTKFDIIKSKLSYIFSQRSANNYKNNIYRLTTQSVFSPAKNITTKNSFQVLANYTVYDFEDIISQVQSFSYRQLSIKDSTSCYITRRIFLEFNGELKFYEQGQFNNRNFSVKPIAYFEEKLFNPQINYLLTGFIRIGAGYKFFIQDRYQYENGVKLLAGNFKTYGPVGEIFFYLKNNSVLHFKGGKDFIKYSVPESENSALYLQLNILWNI